jgi:hypothetical protein
MPRRKEEKDANHSGGAMGVRDQEAGVCRCRRGLKPHGYLPDKLAKAASNTDL